MSEFSTPLQQAVYNWLTYFLAGNPITPSVWPEDTLDWTPAVQTPAIPVYDSVPFQPDGTPQVNFPCIVIGDDTLAPWDTDDSLGTSATITLHVWSRYLGKREVKEIQGRIYAALNRQAANLSAAGYRFVDSLYEFSEIVEEIDGKTRHGISRYRITMEKV